MSSSSNEGSLKYTVPKRKFKRVSKEEIPNLFHFPKQRFVYAVLRVRVRRFRLKQYNSFCLLTKYKLIYMYACVFLILTLRLLNILQPSNTCTK